MKHANQRRACLLAGLVFVLGSSVAFASGEPKVYPEEGKVVGTSTSDVQNSGPHGEHTFTMPGYKIETDTRVYEVRCANSMACGGKNKLEIGEVIRFRVGKKMGKQCLFFQAPGDDKERTVVVLSEELKPDAKPATAEPAKGDSKQQ
jgi:hypothetical protein